MQNSSRWRDTTPSTLSCSFAEHGAPPVLRGLWGHPILRSLLRVSWELRRRSVVVRVFPHQPHLVRRGVCTVSAVCVQAVCRPEAPQGCPDQRGPFATGNRTRTMSCVPLPA